jgi:multimeric flavodoxin WrbA
VETAQLEFSVTQEDAMKVVAVNGSPRLEKGYTHTVLTPFLQGMTEAGADVELFYARRLAIKPCIGDFSCWYEKPGVCIYSDDMELLYPKLSEAEVLVLATPVYIPLPGAMQNLINRIVPLVEPLLETREGRTRARFRPSVHIRQIVLVSVGGWWEKENMEVVVHIAEELAKNGSVEYAGAVLRPHAFLVEEGGELTEEGAAVLEAARQAGHQLVRDGRMNPVTLEAVSRPLISQEELRSRYNRLL